MGDDSVRGMSGRSTFFDMVRCRKTAILRPVQLSALLWDPRADRRPVLRKERLWRHAEFHGQGVLDGQGRGAGCGGLDRLPGNPISADRDVHEDPASLRCMWIHARLTAGFFGMSIVAFATAMATRMHEFSCALTRGSAPREALRAINVRITVPVVDWSWIFVYAKRGLKA